MTRDYNEYLELLQIEFPKFRVVHKDKVWFHRAIHYVLMALTFGKMMTYLTDFTTTLGSTVYVPGDWDAWDEFTRYSTLRHEAVHMRQFKKYGRLLMGFLYLFVPLPLGLAWFRARFEKAAYTESIRVEVEYGYDEGFMKEHFRDFIVSAFTSAAYGWMWPFRKSVERWYDRTLESILRGD